VRVTSLLHSELSHYCPIYSDYSVMNDYQENRRESYGNCSVLYTVYCYCAVCTTVVHSDMHRVIVPIGVLRLVDLGLLSVFCVN